MASAHGTFAASTLNKITMRKTILIYGLIAGAIVSTIMVTSMHIYKNNPDIEPSMLVGYASMLVAFIMIFVGIKNYRDQSLNGAITFGKAFKMGLWIMLIASTMYVITWLIYYYCFNPDYMEKFGEKILSNLAREGASAAKIAEQKAQIKMWSDMYKSPIMLVLITYSEIVPLGLVVTLFSALILKRKPDGENNQTIIAS